MSVKSAPFYWLMCDADDCGYDSRQDGLCVAWVGVLDALDAAADSDWVITDDGRPSRHYCPAHAMNVCRECGAYDAEPYSGERDYLCRPCAAKDDDAA